MTQANDNDPSQMDPARRMRELLQLLHQQADKFFQSLQEVGIAGPNTECIFGYTLAGIVTGAVPSLYYATSITDPNNNVEQKTFDGNGFTTADVYAQGSNVQASYSFTRDPGTELTTAMTDPLGRQFSYGYDANGNLTSVACQNLPASAGG